MLPQLPPSPSSGSPPPSEPPPPSSTSPPPLPLPLPPPPPAAAPEGAVQVRRPSPHTAALIQRLQTAFRHANQHGLCPVAAAAYAARNTPPNTGFAPQPHDFPGNNRKCNCRYSGLQRPHASPAHPAQDRREHTDHAEQEQMNNLRKELAHLDDRQKMAAYRDKLMSRYKRSKTVELEANVRALFGLQYAPVRRTPHAPQSSQGPVAQHGHQPHNHNNHPREGTEARLLGCQHYARNCKLKARCCGLFVSCRFCHDDAMAEDHEMDRFATETILCMLCLTEQAVGPTCVHCDANFAHWYCKDCRFFENTPGKKVYHCNRCNICRLGEGLGIDNFHCDNCDACVSLESKKRHNCMSKALHANCPVCRGYLFTSTEPVVFMRCGHTMHSKCFDDYTSLSYQCPLCMHSLMDMKMYFEKIDEIVRNEPMPPKYEHKRSRILCNDCGNKCVAKYHFVYHKCDNDDCKSYNTMILDVFEVKPASVPPDQQPQNSGQQIIESIAALHADDAGMLDVLSGDCSVAASSNAALTGSW